MAIPAQQRSCVFRYKRAIGTLILLAALNLAALAQGPFITVTNPQGGVFVAITAPLNGATLQNVVAVNAKAYDTRYGTTDGAGIDQVLFLLLKDSSAVASHQELTASYDWSLDVAGLVSNDYVLEAKAISMLGDTATTQITVHTINSPRPPSDWVLTFSDEFDGTGTLDPAKWTLPTYNRRPNTSGPDGYWDASNACLDGHGNLVIAVRKLLSGDYSSACVSTQGETSDGGNADGAKFSQTYGRFECRAQLPTQQGWWVAFWMMQGNQGSIGGGGVDGSEVDIMEAWGWTDRINHAIHWDGYGTNHQSVGASDYPRGIRNGFHVYALIWDPDMYYFYLDSVEVWRTSGGGVCNRPGFLQLTGEISTESWAVDRSWSKDPAAAAYPDSFLVDWVRVYQVQPVGVAGSSSTLPLSSKLEQNYPNPFNPLTSLRYSLRSGSYVALTVYDLLGREVVTVARGFMAAGRFSHVFDASKLASGVYFARLIAVPDDGGRPTVSSIRMQLMR